MNISRFEMINVIKQHCDKEGKPYTHVRTKSGLERLESAPSGNLFYFYKSLTGRGKKETKQLEFDFIT